MVCTARALPLPMGISYSLQGMLAVLPEAVVIVHPVAKDRAPRVDRVGRVEFIKPRRVHHPRRGRRGAHESFEKESERNPAKIGRKVTDHPDRKHRRDIGFRKRATSRCVCKWMWVGGEGAGAAAAARRQGGRGSGKQRFPAVFQIELKHAVP